MFLARAVPAFAQQFDFFVAGRGVSTDVFKKLHNAYAITVHVNEDVYPDFYRDVVKIRALGISVKVYADQISAPKDVRTGVGNIYSVFTPFKNAVWERMLALKPLPKAHLAHATYPRARAQKDLLELCTAAHTLRDVAAGHVEKVFSTARTLCVGLHTLDLDTLVPLGTYDAWYTTEDEALKYFNAWVSRGGLTQYKAGRDSLENDVAEHTVHGVRLYGEVSRISLALCWGLVSARTLTQKVIKATPHTLHPYPKPGTEGEVAFVAELVWREFYKYLLFHNPSLLDTEFQLKFRGTIEWMDDAEALKRFKKWIAGETGYPIVDAAMVQLAQTGWMHNRSRMIVASVLTKNLGVDWRWGQEYFRAALIDLDEASNNGGWQWGASVGADPKPIRIFNPSLQAESHDANKLYQKKWLSADYFAANIQPIVPHTTARDEALQRYKLGDTAPRDF
jgi:deoxyribodipyrimidine photolyase